MFKAFLLISLCAFVLSDEGLFSYCHDRTNGDCDPVGDDRKTNDKWFMCRELHNHGCTSAFTDFPASKRQHPDNHVSFTNGTHFYKAYSSFDTILNDAPFQYDSIVALRSWEEVSVVRFIYHDDEKQEDFFPGDDDINYRSWADNALDAIIVYQRPPPGCIYVFESANFYGDSWKLCEGNFYLNNDRNIFIGSILMGEGVSVQFWDRGDFNWQTRRRLQSKNTGFLRQLDDSNLNCLADNNGNCNYFRYSDDTVYNGHSWGGDLFQPEFITICRRGCEENRCFNNVADQYIIRDDDDE